MVNSLFNKMEMDANARVTAEEFSKHIHDTKMVAFCEAMEVEPADLIAFFSALSGNGKHSVDLDTFVVGCMKLRGTAKSADLMEALMEIRKVNLGIERLLHKSTASMSVSMTRST
mmetsp:Transcript_61352/g.109179  ORF Transcript_61352/g.109179 Transcript_61352/m.109179 type:complete len:115 (+) Transcript_61352:2-346(+)